MPSKRSLSISSSTNTNSDAGKDTISYILSDFRAASFLRRDFDTLVQQKLASYTNIEISGFEIYMVEQWICERKIGAIITSFTGNKDHKLLAVRLTVQKNSGLWPIRFRKYINELIKFQHAKLKNFADKGFIFITNINSFYDDSNLSIKQIDPIYSKSTTDMSQNLVPFPVDYPKFEANFDLKRINCGSRTALLFTNPNKSSEDKFRSMFKVNDSVPIVFAVKELALLLQIALYFFDCINPNYCDGLLCNKTELAIKKWWKTIGCLFFSSIPAQGGSLTSASSIAAIISALISCRSRLNLVITEGINKDPYDIVPFKIAIFQFQKMLLKENNQKSWLLDKATVEKLISTTNDKIAYDNIFKFKKAVNKTVNDISRRNIKISTSIGIETTNFDELALNVQGKRLNYLFLGKGKQVQQSNVLLDIYYSQKKYVDNETPISLNEKETESEIKEASVDRNDDIFASSLSNSELSKGSNKTKLSDSNKNCNESNAHSNDTIDSVINNSNGASDRNECRDEKDQINFLQNIDNQKEYNIITSPKSINFDSPQLSENTPSMLASASNYMTAIKNAANQRKQKINDGLTYVSKPAKNLIGGKKKDKETSKASRGRGDINTELDQNQYSNLDISADSSRDNQIIRSSAPPTTSNVGGPISTISIESSSSNQQQVNTKTKQKRINSSGSTNNSNNNTSNQGSFISKTPKINERTRHRHTHRHYIHQRDKDKSDEKRTKYHNRHNVRVPSKNKNMPLMILKDDHFEKDNTDTKTPFVLPNDSNESLLGSGGVGSDYESLTKKLRSRSFDDYSSSGDDNEKAITSSSEADDDSDNVRSADKEITSDRKDISIIDNDSSNRISRSRDSILNDSNKIHKRMSSNIAADNYLLESAIIDGENEDNINENSYKKESSHVNDYDSDDSEEDIDYDSDDEDFSEEEDYDSDDVIDDYEDGSSMLYKNICNSSMDAIVDEDVCWGSKTQKQIYNNFDRISHRRMSIPETIHDFNLKMLDYDYYPIQEIITKSFDTKRINDEIQSNDGFTTRKRSSSFSKIENVILKINRQLTEECIFRKYLIMKMSDIKIYKDLHSKTYLNYDNTKMINNIYVLDDMQRVTSKLPLPKLMQSIQLFQQVLINRLEFIYKNLINAVQFKRVYDNKTKELRAQNSKFKYEVRLLKIRTRDVENSNKELLDKIQSLKEMGFSMS